MAKEITPLYSTLSMIGFGLLGLSTYAIVCYASMPAANNQEVPPRVFSWGGVLGMHRGTVVVAWHTFVAGVSGIAGLMLCDVVYASHTKARYFALHVICNIWISVLCLPDLWFVLTDPLKALATSQINHWPTALVFSIHVYHILFFRNLQWIDWLHHILMVVIGAPLLITGEVGPLANVNNFFMCGVPGGIDYAMLLAVKHGWIKPLTEKNINAGINVWLRAPSLVMVASLAYIQFFLQPTVPKWLLAVRLFLLGLGVWNGLYFMERVVGNAHVNNYKAKLERQAAKEGKAEGRGRNGNFKDGNGNGNGDHVESVYESAEHLAGSLPGLGMRVSVSTQELAELKKND